MGLGGQRHAPAALPLGKTRYPLIGGWVGPRGGLGEGGKPDRIGIRSPDRLARSESLYRLSCRGSLCFYDHIMKTTSWFFCFNLINYYKHTG